MLLPIREVHVDLLHHLDHHPRNIFLRILIAVELALHMAVCALLAQGGSEVPHHSHDSGTIHGGWQNLQVLGRPAATFALRGLTAECDHGKRSEC